MDIRGISWPADSRAIMEHIRLVHGPGDTDLLEQWYGTMPGFSPDDCFVIDGENGDIAAHLMLIPRAIRLGESVLNASEIGVVGTLETYRGQGYATALMQRAIERMSERGDPLSIIFGIPNFYERWGYEYAVGLYLTSYESSIDTELALKANDWSPSNGYQRRLASMLGVRGKDIVVRTFALDDLPAIMNLYNQASARGQYLFARNEDTWRWQIDYMSDIGRHDNNSFLVAEHDGTMLAYLRMVTSAPVNWFRREDAARFSIVEFAGDDPDATGALLAEAASCARDYDAERIGLFVHPQSTLMEHALARGGTQSAFTGAGFLRINDLDLVLNAMSNTLEQRLEDSPFASRRIVLRVTTEDSSAQLELGGESRMVETIKLEIPAAELVQLLSGWSGLDNVSSGSYSMRHEKVLKVLFPKGSPKIAIADLI
jgi:predicted N-acetyltransferase YhbS